MSNEANKHVFEFLRELSPSLTGLGKNNRTRNTFTASPYLSSSIGVDVDKEQMLLGIPRPIFIKLYKLRIYSVSYILKQPSFFIVFDTQTLTEKGSQAIAVRFYLSLRIVQQMKHFNKVHLVQMEDDGTYTKEKGKHIVLPLRQIEDLEWER